MNRNELFDEWRRLQAEWPELGAYRMVVSARMTSTLGRCFYRERTLKIAEWTLEADDQAVLTLRHEAAHALAGIHDQDYGHGPAWKRWARRLGTSDSRCAGPECGWKEHAPAALARKLVWTATCDKCGHQVQIHQTPRGGLYEHRSCGGTFRGWSRSDGKTLDVPTRPTRGVTRRVWEIADALEQEWGGRPDRSEVIRACEWEGINRSTAATQYGKWLKARRWSRA